MSLDIPEDEYRLVVINPEHVQPIAMAIGHLAEDPGPLRELDDWTFIAHTLDAVAFVAAMYTNNDAVKDQSEEAMKRIHGMLCNTFARVLEFRFKDELERRAQEKPH